MKKLILFLLFSSSWALAQNQCETVFSLSQLEIFLSTQLTETSKNSVVKYTSQQESESIILSKSVDQPWISVHWSKDSGLSVEGDVRNPMFIFGSQLSQKMGFEIVQDSANTLKIKIPDAKKIARFVKATNKELVKMGKGIISYLPVRFGYATSQQMLKLSVSGKGSYDLLFPYADRDPTLVSHEISYHLGALLLSPQILERTRVVTERHLQFIQLLKEKGNFLGIQLENIIAQIEVDRAFELDVGTGNTSYFLSSLKKDYPGKSYKDFANKQIPQFETDLSYLVRGDWTPTGVVIARVLKMIVNFNLSNFNFKNFLMPQTTMGHGAKTKLSEYQAQKLIQLLKEFSSIYEAGDAEKYPPIVSSVLVHDFLDQLDQRVQDINEAAKKAGF